jgi:hypothetical protein
MVAHSLVAFFFFFFSSSESDRELMQWRKPVGSGHHQTHAPDVRHSWRTRPRFLYHAIAYVQLFFHTSFLDWRREAGPSGARIKFRVGGKYAIAAADAFIDALVLAVVVVFA